MKLAGLSIVFALTAIAQVSGTGSQSTTSSAGALAAKPGWSPETIRVEHEVVKARDRIRLFIDCKNISDQPILIGEELKNPKMADLRYPVQVRDEKGSLAPETKWGRRVRTGKDDPGKETVQVGSYHERYVQPGETYTDGIELNGLYDLSQPGKYTVQIVKIDENGNVVFKSNVVVLTVTK